MARGEKSGNPEMKRHRAARIADRMMQDGATRMDANRIATAAMDREYAGDRGNLRGASVDVDRHDSGSGQRKTNLTTKRGASVSGASKPNAAKTIGTTKGGVKKTGRGGKASSGRKPRTTGDVAIGEPSANKSAQGKRAPIPRKAAGTKHPNAGKNSGANQSKTTKRAPSKRVPRSTGPGAAGSARKAPLAGRASTAKKASGVSRTATRRTGGIQHRT